MKTDDLLYAHWKQPERDWMRLDLDPSVTCEDLVSILGNIFKEYPEAMEQDLFRASVAALALGTEEVTAPAAGWLEQMPAGAILLKKVPRLRWSRLLAGPERVKSVLGKRHFLAIDRNKSVFTFEEDTDDPALWERLLDCCRVVGAPAKKDMPSLLAMLVLIHGTPELAERCLAPGGFLAQEDPGQLLAFSHMPGLKPETVEIIGCFCGN